MADDSKVPYEKIFEHMTECITITNNEGYIQLVNPAFEQVFGYGQKELVGMHASDLLSLNLVDKAKAVNVIIQALEKNGEWAGELFHRRKDGSSFPTFTNIRRISDTHRSAWLYLHQDISELTEKLLKRQETQLFLSARMTALGEMAAGMAHEIHNPLTVILGQTERMAHAIETGQIQRESLLSSTQKIQLMVDAITQIISGLRSFGRAPQGEAFQANSLKDIVQYSLEFWKGKFALESVDVTVDDIPASLQMECSSHQIAEALLCLLKNAYEATLGTPKRWIRIQAKTQGSVVELSVTDSGPGIPKEIRKKIFAPFFTSKDIKQGTGLGLSIAKGIVESHGGTLELDETSPNTRFVLRLPRWQQKVKKAA